MIDPNANPVSEQIKCFQCGRETTADTCLWCVLAAGLEAAEAKPLGPGFLDDLPLSSSELLIADKYRVLEVVGRGGMGVVYKAWQTNLDRVVAVKMVSSGVHASADEKERFLREAKLVARLQLAQVKRCEPAPPRRLNPNVPVPLETICLKCLQKEPERRYTSAQALVGELERFLKNKPILAKRSSRLDQVRRWVINQPLVASLTVILIAVLFLCSGILYWHWYTAATLREAEKSKNKSLTPMSVICSNSEKVGRRLSEDSAAHRLTIQPLLTAAPP
jgi:serine/threonine protein kinase